MTVIVNQKGGIYEKGLEEETAGQALAMTYFDPKKRS